MAVKKPKYDPEANPHLFLNFLQQSIRNCKNPEIVVRVLRSMLSDVSDEGLKHLTRRADEYFAGKKTTRAKRKKFRRKCLRKLRAIRKKARKNGDPIPEKVHD